MQELRTLVGVARHLARSRLNWDQRHLVMTDSQVALCCIWKGRSASFPLLRQLRRLAAIWMALGIRLSVRWVPTQFNNADGPSRGAGVGILQKESDSKPTAQAQQLAFDRPDL